MRYPTVAGAFYPGNPVSLKQMLEGYLSEAKKKVKQREAFAAVCPHAGYVYSGFTAAHSFASISNIVNSGITVVFFGPNHTGFGKPIALSLEDWQTPLGVLQCDKELAKAIKQNSARLEFDEMAHQGEHSIEVQLPFLQMLNPSAKIVCICMMDQSTEGARDIGNAVLKAARKLKREIVVIGSSDFTHYESADSAKRKDTPAIDLLCKLDFEGFNSYVEKNRVSICGHGPISAATCYAKLCGAKSGELIRYTSSGEASGDFSEVVAYASIGFFKP